MHAPPDTIAGRYRIIRELGRGGMGVVYLVEHTGTGDNLALKVLLNHSRASAEMIERFKREAKAPARIKSENVVRVTDTDVAAELDGAPFMVMELLNGHDLEKTLHERTLLPPWEAIGLLRQAAKALDKAHALGITHRDLKPENLFLHRRENGEEVLKILDFGISKLSGDANDIASAGLTKTGAMMGTPLYMSPEQARGRTQEVGPPTDIWAIGLIAYRLITGTIYWQAATLAELMVQIISEPMQPPSSIHPSLPSGFDEWFARSTDRSPGNRFRTVGEQVEALAAIFGLQPLTASTSGARAAITMSAASMTAPAATMPPGHATSANLASSRLGSTTAGSSRGRMYVAAGAVAVLIALGAYAGLRTPSGPAAATPGAEPSEPSTPKNVSPKPIETAETPDLPAPTITQAAHAPAVAAPTGPHKTAPSASASTKASATVVAKPEAKPDAGKPVEAVAAPPPEPKPAPPPPAPTPEVKKKFDPSAP